MKPRPDYDLIEQLEDEFGFPLSERPPRRLVPELDAAVADTFRLLLSWRRDPDLPGSWVLAAARVAVQGLLAAALVLTCLMLAGVLPW